MHSSADAFDSSGGRNFSVGLCAILSVFRAVIRPSVAGSDMSLLRCNRQRQNLYFCTSKASKLSTCAESSVSRVKW
jgi:hypothetical protein